MASMLTSETTEPSGTYLYPPRKSNPYSTRMVLYTGIGATGLMAMRITLEILL